MMRNIRKLRHLPQGIHHPPCPVRSMILPFPHIRHLSPREIGQILLFIRMKPIPGQQNADGGEYAVQVQHTDILIGKTGGASLVQNLHHPERFLSHNKWDAHQTFRLVSQHFIHFSEETFVVLRGDRSVGFSVAEGASNDSPFHRHPRPIKRYHKPICTVDFLPPEIRFWRSFKF